MKSEGTQKFILQQLVNKTDTNLFLTEFEVWWGRPDFYDRNSLKCCETWIQEGIGFIIVFLNEDKVYLL
jgi:hypothetical protein